MIVLLYIERKNGSHVFASSLTTKRAKLTWLPLEIIHCGHTWHDYPWPWVSLTWLLYNLQLWRHGRWFLKVTVRFRPIRTELESSMYNSIKNSIMPFLNYKPLKLCSPMVGHFGAMICISNWTEWSTIQGVINCASNFKIGRARNWNLRNLKLRARLRPELYDTRSNY